MTEEKNPYKNDPYKVCITCDRNLHINDFYEDHDHECAECIESYRESKGYQGYGSQWQEGFRLTGGYEF